MKIRYQDRYIIIEPKDSEESNRLIPVLNQANLFLYNRATLRSDGWYIRAEFLSTLNKALTPFRGQIEKDASLVAYIEQFKEQQIQQGAQSRSGLLIQKFVNVCKIIGPSKYIPLQDIDKATKYFFKGAENSKKYKSGVWDGYIHLYHKYNRTFPTGLLSIIEGVLKRKDVPYRIELRYQEAPPRQFDWTVDDGITPDPDQIEAVEAGLQGRRGIMKAPTGFGKTAVLAKRLTAGFGVPTLFVANKKALLDDAAEEFRTGIKGLTSVGQIKDGYFDTARIVSVDGVDVIPDITSPVIVATIQSLSARLNDPNSKDKLSYWLNNVCKFVMVDECQAVGTKIWDEVLDACKAPYRILLSATPWRTDGATLCLTAASGPTLYSTTAEEQIEKNRLCDLDIYYHEFDHKVYNDRDTGIPYAEAYASYIVGNEERNKEVVRLAMSLVEEERLTLVFVTNIDHGHLLRQMFLDAGMSPNEVRFIWGGTKNKDRVQGVKDFKEGKFKVLIGSTIFDAGVNIPAISGAVVAGAGNADITIIQKIGRAARNCDYEKVLGYIPKFMQGDGKKCSKIYDFVDVNVCYFRKQSKNRYYTLQKEYGKDRVHFLGGASARSFRMPPKKAAEDVVIQETMRSFLKDYEEFKTSL